MASVGANSFSPTSDHRDKLLLTEVLLINWSTCSSFQLPTRQGTKARDRVPDPHEGFRHLATAEMALLARVPTQHTLVK